MTPTMYVVTAIAVMAAVTFITRALPFLLFGGGKEAPGVILYLGKVLPPAIIAMLIVYCLRGVEFSVLKTWVPTLAASAVVVILHLWKKNSMLSIVGGTALYMTLVQVVF